ncbi:IS982 family transposase [Bernardetia sp. MNP-M8]|uniref:IS982 family transposase n=2 Tax=Bernardetia sp. MNP-M8 TaxID=3127470 RepID=UPI0030D1147F
MFDKTIKFDEDHLIGIFYLVDEFCLQAQSYVSSKWVGTKSSSTFTPSPTRLPQLSASEIMTILVYYNYSGYKNFQYYYQRFVCNDLVPYFPKLCSYNRFLELIERVSLPMYVLAKLLCAKSEETGTYFIDSKKIVISDNRRIHSHKVFKDIAKRGKGSMGWFFGFKLHLVINHLGEVMAFEITAANKADNNHNLLKNLLKNLKGNCFGDKGYLTKLWEQLYEKGLKMITKTKKNMKNQLITLKEKYTLRKRAIIESVNDILISVFDVEHSRHRKPINAFTHMAATIVAYHFYPEKPRIFVPK